MRWSELLHQIVESLLSVPDRVDGEVKLLDRLQGDLLIDVTTPCPLDLITRFDICIFKLTCLLQQGYAASAFHARAN